MIREVVCYGRAVAGNWAAANVHPEQWTVRTSDGGELQDRIRRGWKRHGAPIAVHIRERRRAYQRASAKYRRGERTQGIVTPALAGFVLLTALGFDWNPVSWWDTVSGWAGQGWQDVKNFVHAAIDTALGLVDGAFNLIDYVFTVLFNTVEAGLNIVGSIASGAFDWIVHAAETVGSWIWAGIVAFWNDVIVPAINVVTSFAQWVWGEASWLISQIQNGLTWLVDNIVTPAWDWIVHAAETVGGWIWDAIIGFYNDVILPTLHGLIAWVDLLASIWDWLSHTAVAVVNAVIAAWQWIIWFGEHTFDDLKALFDGDLEHVNRQWLLAAGADMQGPAESMIKIFERILE